MATRSFTSENKPRGRQRLHWMVGLLGLIFALFPLIQAGSVAARPHITEFPAPSRDQIGGVQGITAGSDGALWFTAGSNFIGRITTKGAVTTFQLPSFEFNAQEITTGPDKALWITLPNANPSSLNAEIGRLTTQGVFTGFKIPFHSNPFDITSGSDGNLYFTDRFLPDIDRITPQGKVTRFPYKDISGGYPVTLTSGPDGNLWFIDFNAGRIGKMTTSGQFTFFIIPGAQRGEHGGLLDDITAGPDGNVWFTIDGFRGNSSIPQIGRITPSGVITEFHVPNPTGNATLPGIATGADGNLWFTYLNGQLGEIGRITPSGKIRLFPTPTQVSAPQDITAGSDGNLWFTEEVQGGLSNVIGRITTH